MIRRIQIVEPNEAEKDFWKGFPLIRKRRERRLNATRLRKALGRFAGLGDGGRLTDPYFDNVLFLQDWETDPANNANNPNLGSWVGTQSLANMAINSATTLHVMGSGDIITSADAAAVRFAAWDIGTTEWTIQWSAIYNGTRFPDENTDGSLHYEVSMDDADTNDRCLILTWEGDGAGNHVAVLRTSANGTTRTVHADKNFPTATLTAAGSFPVTVYHWALERSGDDVNLYQASASRADGTEQVAETVEYTRIATWDLGASYDFFNATPAKLSFGVNESGSPVAASGRRDNIRVTEGVARMAGAATFTDYLPFPRF